MSAGPPRWPNVRHFALVPSSDCMGFEYHINPMRFMSSFKSVLIGYQASLKSCQWRPGPVLLWNIVCDGIRKTHIAARYFDRSRKSNN